MCGFLYVDDMADARVFFSENGIREGIFNVTVVEDLTIGEFAATVADFVGFSGEIMFDASKPDGMYRNLLDVNRFANSLGR